MADAFCGGTDIQAKRPMDLWATASSKNDLVHWTCMFALHIRPFHFSATPRRHSGGKLPLPRVRPVSAFIKLATCYLSHCNVTWICKFYNFLRLEPRNLFVTPVNISIFQRHGRRAFRGYCGPGVLLGGGRVALHPADSRKRQPLSHERDRPQRP